MSTFFTSDTHLGHYNIIRYCNRPFKTADEMDEKIISNWNSVVKSKDTVYHIGDFCFGDAKDYLDRLNGHIIFVQGNHDKPLQRILSPLELPFKRAASINGQYIVLSHFAMRVWDKSHFNAWHLYGHSHNTLPSSGKSFDVGVDAWNYYPISFEQVKKQMSLQPNNPNWIERLPGYNREEYHEECKKENGEPINGYYV